MILVSPLLQVTALRDVKASGNWMYAAKLDGEGAAMYDAALALRDAMIELEIAIDGGKDSLSMAAQAGGETVKAPGNLVISAYCTCSDITKTVTPDLKVRIVDFKVLESSMSTSATFSCVVPFECSLVEADLAFLPSLEMQGCYCTSILLMVSVALEAQH